MTTDKPEDTRTPEERYEAGRLRHQAKVAKERRVPPLIVTNRLNLPFSGCFPDHRKEDEK